MCGADELCGSSLGVLDDNFLSSSLWRVVELLAALPELSLSLDLAFPKFFWKCPHLCRSVGTALLDSFAEL